MRRWYKEAEVARDERGNLVPWEPAQTRAREVAHAAV